MHCSPSCIIYVPFISTDLFTMYLLIMLDAIYFIGFYGIDMENINEYQNEFQFALSYTVLNL